MYVFCKVKYLFFFINVRYITSTASDIPSTKPLTYVPISIFLSEIRRLYKT